MRMTEVTKRKQILLVGAGGHARSCIEAILSTSEWAVGGVVGRAEEVGSEILGVPVVGCDDDLSTLREKYDFALVSVGQIKSASTRKRLYETLKGIGFSLPVVKASSAIISPFARIGEGTIVFHHAYVGPNVVIGPNAIVNTGAILEHEVCVGVHCHISTGAILNGEVVVGDESFVGSGAVVVEGQNLPIGSFIKAGTRHFVRR